MNVIDYITITCNLKNVRLQITSDYMKKCNRLQRLQLQITITPCLATTGGNSNRYDFNLSIHQRWSLCLVGQHNSIIIKPLWSFVKEN